MSGLFVFLLVLEAVVASLLVTVILMQRSEGGGLGMGGGPAGLMSARSAADFLTRSTSILATIFVVLSILLAGLATQASSRQAIDQSLQRSQAGRGTVPGSTPAGGAPVSGGIPVVPQSAGTPAGVSGGIPIQGAAPQSGQPNAAAPAQATPKGANGTPTAGKRTDAAIPVGSNAGGNQH